MQISIYILKLYVSLKNVYTHVFAYVRLCTWACMFIFLVFSKAVYVDNALAIFSKTSSLHKTVTNDVVNIW